MAFLVKIVFVPPLLPLRKADYLCNQKLLNSGVLKWGLSFVLIVLICQFLYGIKYFVQQHYVLWSYVCSEENKVLDSKTVIL